MKKEIWIIGTCFSDSDGVSLAKYEGTKEDIKKHIMTHINNLIENNQEIFDYGTEDIEDIEESNGELYAYAVFSDCHFDLSAKPLSNIVVF